MRIKCASMVLLIGMAPSLAWASVNLRFGLGSAVAKRGADAINQAGASDAAKATGDAVIATLDSCPAGAVYDSPPTDLSLIRGIEPLGHVAPPPHTFPSDHIYFYATTSTVEGVPVYAPGNVHITDIASTQYLSASPVFTDYAVYFYPCKQLRTYYGHVRTLSPAVQRALDGAAQNCSTYSTGDRTYYRCDTNVNIPLASGDLIGNGPPGGAFDFGSYDDRVILGPFAAPVRHADSYQSHTVCPVDYFTTGPKTSMQALLGRGDGGYRRQVLPLCGQYNHDVAGTARGFWYYPGAPNVPEDPHLSLIVDDVYAPKETISVGTSLPNQTPIFYTFVANDNGQVDREFSEVRPDGNIYCYDTFYDPAGQLAGSHIFILQLLNAQTIRFESQPDATCGAGPWSFTTNAVNFER